MLKFDIEVMWIAKFILLIYIINYINLYISDLL